MTAESYAPTSGAHRPGHLITAERMKAYLVPRVRMPARAWKIRHSSTTATGRPTTVTGMVLVPPTPYAGPRPLIGYGIGTQGLSKYSAPSRQIALGIEYEASVIASALRLGSIAPKAPVLIGAGTHDQVIPYSQARNLFREWRDGGADVHLRTMPIREHTTGGISFAPAAFAFLARHLVQAGRR